MPKHIPQRRHTTSRDAYWRDMFNRFSLYESVHAISGWSKQGLSLRIEAYLNIVSDLRLPSDALVLDLGCGAGVYSQILAAKGFKVVGADYAWLVAHEAKKRSNGGIIDFLSADAVWLPFVEDLFDHVVCIGLFQSLEKHVDAIREIYRVLKPDGVLFLMTLNRMNVKACFDRWFGREEIIIVNGENQPRLNTFVPGTFGKELQHAGFGDVITRPVQIYPKSLVRIRPLINLCVGCVWVCFLTARSFSITCRKIVDR